MSAMTTLRDPPSSLIDALAAIVGRDNVITDPKRREILGTDIFYKRTPPLLGVRPRSSDEVPAIVKAVAAGGCTLAPRGGGLSYSAGYLTDREDTVTLDMGGCNRIIEINADDMYVRVEAGVTWNQLNEALKPHGLRTPFWGTGSGLVATVGGGLSQNAINYGSARWGFLADSVIGLKVVLGDGRELRTGAWANNENPIPFTRHYGPDLTGLFCADAGAMAVKTEVVLQLIQRPGAVRYAAFSFDRREDFTWCMSEVARRNLVTECFGIDPWFLSERIASTGFADDIQKLINVAKEQNSVLGGLKAAFDVAVAGRHYLKGVGYTVHMTMDGRDDDDAESELAEVREICKGRGGKEIEASIPRIMRGTPFPPPLMMLGPDGDRWVPMHGIVPHSKHLTVLERVDDYFNRHSSVISQHNLVWGHVSNLIGRSCTLVEVNFYWKDARTAMIESYLDPSFVATKKTFPPAPETWAAVNTLRSGLSAIFRDLGGFHMQIGRSYPFLESRRPENQALLRALKAYLDPKGIINPGALGLP
ncbi:MAG: FAD-binding oxidoreductase [Alphaproteobacteria bacterium]|nr:FAD-binding oxidoreductase [Alphaproteobacteria bacterium]